MDREAIKRLLEVQFKPFDSEERQSAIEDVRALLNRTDQTTELSDIDHRRIANVCPCCECDQGEWLYDRCPTCDPESQCEATTGTRMIMSETSEIIPDMKYVITPEIVEDNIFSSITVTPSDQISVIQSDREAVADLYRADWGIDTLRAIRAGERDNWRQVQAFARHRIFSATTTRISDDEMFDSSTSPPIDMDESHGEAWMTGYEAACRVIRDCATPAQDKP